MRRAKLSFILVVLVMWTSAIPGQDVLTNEDVAKLLQAGMGDAVVLAALESKPCQFDTSPEALIALKQAGASDQVIAAMLKRVATPAVPRPAIAQDNPSVPVAESEMTHKWNGLVLDETNAEVAIGRLGDPDKDRMASIDIFKLGHRFAVSGKGDAFRELSFKLSTEQDARYEKALAYFLDGRLIVIEVHFRDDYKPTPLGLPKTLGITFTPAFSGWDQILSSGLERDQGKVYPKVFPHVYAIVGEGQKSVVVAEVRQSLKKKFTLGLIKEVDDGWPGKVTRMQLISRSLEHKAAL